MPVTFVGDVHGWSDRLDRVVAQTEGPLVLMGDLIDRGPDSRGVIERVRAWCDVGRASCLMGNHEYAMVRGMGVPELGIPPAPALFQAWSERYGGAAALASFGATDADSLRRSLGGLLPWLAQLPWVLEGEADGRRWFAVHAGLGSFPHAPQLAELRDPQAILAREPLEQPAALYAKSRAFLLPTDWPDDWCLVSGHTPVGHVRLHRNRVLCDTSGGLSDRRLSGVIWPQGRVVQS